MKNNYYERLLKYVDDIRKITDFEPEIAIVLGSGLGNFANLIDVVAEVNYKELEGFPFSTAPGHEGKFIFGTVAGKKVVCMKGRIHYYEGYEMCDVVLPMRVMHLLGAQSAIITNAVGCMNPDFKVGSFMAVNDCIASFVPSPLIGPNIDELGVRFPDMTELYSREYIDIIKEIGKEENIDVNEGVFIQLTGPQYETASEIRFYKAMGADCAGMSSAVEAIAAHHMGMKVAEICCITNMSTGISATKLTEEEVLEIAGQVSGKFETLVKKLVERI